MKLNFIIALFFCLSINALACVCETKPEFKSKDDLKEYKFIAHIKITGIQANKENQDYHQMSFETKELFKGEKLSMILVYGSNQSVGRWTSCDLGEIVGEEWIIFGYKDENKKMITGYCTRSKKIKSISGYEDIGYPLQITLKEQLRSIFGIVSSKIKYDGKRLTYYKNGSTQLEENYSDGKLTGERKLWYPNRVLESKQYYKNGKMDSIFNWYSSQGDLIKIEKFKNGIPIDTTTIWREIDTSYIALKIHSDLNNVSMTEAKKVLSKSQVWIKRVFDDSGNINSQMEYYENGKVQHESIYGLKEVIYRFFYENGVLSAEEIYQKDIKSGVYREWDEKGKLKTYWEIDNKKNAIKETVKRY